MSDNKKNRIIAGVITAIISLLVLLVLIYSHISTVFPPEDKEDLLAMEKQENIMFGGEYVMLGDVEEPATDELAAPAEPEATPAEKAVEASEPEPKPTTQDLKDAGAKGEASKPLNTQKAESPMKVKENKTPVKAGPTKEELAAEAKAKKQKADEEARAKKAAEEKAAAAAAAKKQKEASDKINKRVSFGSGTGTGSGKQGSPNGNSSTGAVKGSPGISGLNGYTLASWGRPSSPEAGVIKIKVRVSARGKVLSANYAGGSGAAASNAAVRRSCEQASLSSSFSVPVNTTTEGVGYITWRFE